MRGAISLGFPSNKYPLKVYDIVEKQIISRKTVGQI